MTFLYQKAESLNILKGFKALYLSVIKYAKDGGNTQVTKVKFIKNTL